MEISGALAAFLKLPVTIKRSYAPDLIEDLSHESVIQKAGLITWLHIYSNWTDHDAKALQRFAAAAKNLLAPSGRVIMTLVEDDENRHKNIDEIIDQGIPGLRLSKFYSSSENTGKLVLLGEKLQ